MYLQSEQFISRNTESADRDKDICSISMMIPKFLVAFLLHSLTASSISKLTHVPPTGVSLGIVLESRTGIKITNKWPLVDLNVIIVLL